MFFIFCLIISVNLTCSAHKLTKNYNRTENILCRDCGSVVLTSDTITSKLSTASSYSFNDTIFNRNKVLVQLLNKDIFFRYPIITSSHSSCLGKGDWEDDDLWFPDYDMKPCFCSECGALVGWMYQNDNPSVIQSTDTFFGLILTNLIGENFINSLIRYPDSVI